MAPATSSSPILPTIAFDGWIHSGTITTFAGTGEPGFSGDSGPAADAQLNVPDGVAVDGAGNLFIADTWNNRIRRVDPSGTITTFAGPGRIDFGPDEIGDDGPAADAQLNLPSDVAVDAAGSLFIADFGNNRIRRVDPSGTITTFAGTGEPGFSGDSGPAGRSAAMEARRISGGHHRKPLHRRFLEPPYSTGGSLGNHHHLRGYRGARLQRGQRARRRYEVAPARRRGSGWRGQPLHR